MRPDLETNTANLRPEVGPAPACARKIDRYQLQNLIGCGGMGAVYRALDTKLGRTVALKTATGQRAGARLTDRVRQRFLREAMALSKVEHRNVVQVLDFGFADDGTPFLVMEHLRGQDLGARLATATAPLAVTEAVDIMLGVCAALRACHRVGIIHRDLKPGNIFLAETDTGCEVKVLDFGVSKAPTADDLTREGQILGTPQYLAPEQIDGKVGPASDQYALGVLLYVCLTLRLPYEDHENRDLLRAIETGKFEAPRALRPELPPELEAILLRAMHVSPSDRFESVYALGQRLWSLASPRAQEEWRGYYRPPAGDPRAESGPLLAKTQILEDSADADADADAKMDGGALLRLPTRAVPAELASPVADADLDDPWEPEALLDGLRAWQPRSRVLLAAVTMALGIASLIVVPRRFERHVRSHAAAMARPAPLPRVAPPATGPLRGVPGPVPVSAPLPPPSSLLGPPPPSPPPAPDAAAGRARSPRHRAPPRHQHAPFPAPLPNIDQFGIGIPAD
ncbi:MAG TPA: serine/threonine-protein kinase [Polyangia bacterium]|jgi:serine/threonine-protein kinase